MPPVKKIKREDILNTAYLITKTKGLANVNARAIAKKLNCSIQPIFHNFHNMEELKKEVVQKITDVYKDYLLKNVNSKIPYKEIGLGYIRFAKEEPYLFQVLFMSEHKIDVEEFIKKDETYQIIKNYIQQATGFEGEQLNHFHMKIWVFTHGLATLLATKTCALKEEQIEKMLSDIFLSVYREEKRK